MLLVGCETNICEQTRHHSERLFFLCRCVCFQNKVSVFTRLYHDRSIDALAHTPAHSTASAAIIQTNPLTDPSCCSLNGVQSVFWA